MRVLKHGAPSAVRGCPSVSNCAALSADTLVEGVDAAQYRLIPLTGAQLTSGTLVVPYTIDMIVASPDASSVSDTLEGELLEQVQAHYALDRQSTDVGTAGSTESAARDTVARTGLPQRSMARR